MIINQCLRAGQPIPDVFANPPELFFGSSFYLEAFIVLDRERNTGFDIGYIPLRSIIDYGLYYGLNSDELHDLVTIIQIVDNEMTKHRKSKG